MTTFHAVVAGDPLDSGGYVLDGGNGGTIAGNDGKRRRIAFVGQWAWCSTCESVGTIEAAPGAPANGRMRDLTCAGRIQALSNDRVRCRCERAPRIVSRYGRKWKIDARGDDTDSASAGVAPMAPAGAAPAYDDRFVLRDTTGTPLRHVAYALQRDTGLFEYGRTDAHGRTHLLASAPQAENVVIYLAE